MQEETTAQILLKAVGGVGNVIALEACMTRVRVKVQSKERVNTVGLKDYSWLIGYLENDDEYQFILGPGNTESVLDELKILCSQLPTINEAQIAAGVAENAPLSFFSGMHWEKIINGIVNTFVPLVPIFIACALIKTVSTLSQQSFFGFVAHDYAPNALDLLALFGQTVFDFLHIFVGVNAAKAFGGSPIVGGIIGAIIYNPKLATITWFGSVLVPERGGLISVLLATALASTLEHEWNRKLKGMAALFLPTLLTIGIVGFLSVSLLQPLGGYLSNLLVNGTEWLLETGGIVTGAVLGGSFLFLVFSGLHQALLPIHLSLMTQQGSNPLFTILCMPGLAQVGVALCLYGNFRKESLKSILPGGIFSGLLGIDEPLLFGMSLPSGKAFLATCLGGAVGGAWISYWAVASTIPYGMSGLTLLLGIAEGKVVYYLAGCLISLGSGYGFGRLLANR